MPTSSVSMEVQPNASASCPIYGMRKEICVYLKNCLLIARSTLHGVLQSSHRQPQKKRKETEFVMAYPMVILYRTMSHVLNSGFAMKIKF